MKEEDKITEYEKRMQGLQAQAMQSDIDRNNTSILESHRIEAEKEPGMIKEQLSLGEELKTIDYLLRGWSLGVDKNGSHKWMAPESEDMMLLSEYGVHYFRGKIAWNIHKNRLLSAYESEEVKTKMFDIANTINDDIFHMYEKIFRMPSVKRCIEELEKRIKERSEVRKFAYDSIGLAVEEDKITEEIKMEIESNIEKELMKIREKLFSDKFKRFPSLLRDIQDVIDDTYHRAIGGQERRSLRQHMQITETKGGYQQPPENKGGLFSWGKK